VVGQFLEVLDLFDGFFVGEGGICFIFVGLMEEEVLFILLGVCDLRCLLLVRKLVDIILFECLEIGMTGVVFF